MGKPTTSRSSEKSTLSAAASRSHVKTSARLAKAQESPENDPGFGRKCGEWLAKFDHDTCSWRTAQFSLAGDLELFSETWPRWGMMRDGALYPLPTSDLATSESASIFLPTPSHNDGRGYYVASRKSAQARIDGDHQMHWIHVALLCGDLSKGWANPQFSELMMDWPIKWTDLRPLETDKFQQWLDSHGRFLTGDNS